MIHTREELLSEVLEQCNRNEHKCCIDKAMGDWFNLFFSDKHQDFFVGLIQKTIDESDSLGHALTELAVMCLALGSVCGLGMLPLLMQKFPQVTSLKGKKEEIH